MSWSERTPTFGRTVRALFKKTILLKIRHPASIVEFVLACAIVFPLQPVYEVAKREFDGFADPPLVYPSNNFSQNLAKAMLMYTDSKIVLIPPSELMHQIGGTFDMMLELICKAANMSERSYKVTYKDTPEEMEELIYSSDATGLGLRWHNTEGVALSNFQEMIKGIQDPKIEYFAQSLAFDPILDILEIIRMIAAGYMAGVANQTLSLDPNSTYMKTVLNQAMEISQTNWSTQTYATVSTVERYPIQIAVCFFAVLPIILSVMPDFQTLLEEKDNKVAAFTFLMGCPETAYWLVNFLMPLILSIPPYILFTALLTQWFGMVGTDFLLFFLICLLFVISHIWFIFFLSAFMKSGASGRSITVLLLVLVSFFGFLHQYFTLDENNSSEAVKHVFSIVPLSCFELVLMSMYGEAMNSQPPFTWATANRDMTYPPSYGLIWLAADAVIYFLLFALLNLTMPRQFGTPPLGWRGLVSISAWRRMFQEDNMDVGRLGGGDADEFLGVNGLSKVYHGQKDVHALRDVEFTIKTGEVIVVIGPNGAGKSTLINVIAGATEPSTGTMRLLSGDETSRFKQIQRYLGVVFQDNVIIGLLSIREHMELFGAFRGIPEDVLQESIDFFAHTLQLTHMLENRAGDLSGGQKRKLCISLSLLGNPPIVIMDEPTAGVDVQARQLIWKTIASLEQTTSLITSHALEEAEAVSSRLFIVSQGKVPFCGTSTELRNKYQCGYLLRIQGGPDSVRQVLELAQSHVPSARRVEDREDTIAMPVDAAVPAFLTHLQENLAQYGVNAYSFSVEQLEDMLLKLIQSDEAAYQG